MEDAFYAFRYSQQFVGRSEKVENVILNYIDENGTKDSDIALWYAQEIIKSNWPEAEKIISKNASNAFKYVKDCINENNINEVTSHIHIAAFSRSPYDRKRYVSLLKERKIDFNTIANYI